MNHVLTTLILFLGGDMLPHNELSSKPVTGKFVYDLGVELTPFLDYKAGGVNIQDPTKGLDYQIWRGRVFQPDSPDSYIVLDARYSPEHYFFAYPNIIEFNFSFDFSMRPMAVIVAREIIEIMGEETEVHNTYLYWFDNTKGRYDMLFLDNLIKTPKLLIDDPREVESDFYSLSDTCLFYWRSGDFFVRYLRDRFTIEHRLKRNIPYIQQIGMNEHYRMQFQFLKTKQECEDKKVGTTNGCNNKTKRR